MTAPRASPRAKQSDLVKVRARVRERPGEAKQAVSNGLGGGKPEDACRHGEVCVDVQGVLDRGELLCEASAEREEHADPNDVNDHVVALVHPVDDEHVDHVQHDEGGGAMRLPLTLDHEHECLITHLGQGQG